MEAIERLTPHLYTLAQFSQASAAKSVLSVIREKYEEFQRRPKSGVALELVSDIDVRVTGRLQALNCHHALCYKSTLYLLS